jgi:dGTPase
MDDEKWEERKDTRRKPQDDDTRKASDIDYARVIHSASFRRLQGKTQILSLGDSDFYRNRLTHSLEVAQIAGGIIQQIEQDYKEHDIIKFLPDKSLMQTLGCTHDLGHPPFGHGGEVALNFCMKDYGGFESNGQTLRILSKLEKFSPDDGANLCRRTLLGVLKYPAPFSTVNNLTPKSTAVPGLIDLEDAEPPKCYLDSEKKTVQWILEPLQTAEKEAFQYVKRHVEGHGTTKHKSFDCSVMDIADELSYGVHDLEDAIALKLLTREDFEEIISRSQCKDFLDNLNERYKDEFESQREEEIYDSFLGQLFGKKERKRAISRLVHYFITAVKVEDVNGKGVCFEEPLLRFRITLEQEQKNFLAELHKIVRKRVIFDPLVQQLEFKGKQMVVSVFEALASDPKRFLPQSTFERFDNSNQDRRIICDYVAGMTDNYLLKTYERLFSPRMGSVFDRL